MQVLLNDSSGNYNLLFLKVFVIFLNYTMIFVVLIYKTNQIKQAVIISIKILYVKYLLKKRILQNI